MVMDMFAGTPARQGDRASTPASSSSASWPGVADPEAKRKIIGREFVEVFQARGRAS